MPFNLIDSTVFVFPGQGSQALMMGKDFFDEYDVSRDVFNEVDDALKFKLSDIIFGDNKKELLLTQNCQPAIMAVSMAILRAVEFKTGTSLSKLCFAAAGHSLGEYTALCASGCISIGETAKILQERGISMAKAALNIEGGGMVAIIDGSVNYVKSMLKDLFGEGEDVVIANDNSETQIVLSGTTSGIDKILSNYKYHNIRKAIKLDVAGPFHSHFMSEAKERMAEVLQHTTINPPLIPVVSNVSAQIETIPSEIKKNLIHQIDKPVRWRESINLLKEKGMKNMVEVGNGSVLSGLLSRNHPEIKTLSISKAHDPAVKEFFNL